jgi:hypothetical protein
MSDLGIDELLESQVAPLKAKLVAMIAASTGLATGAIQSYELETGMTRQKVTKVNLDVLEAAIDSLMNTLTTLEARLRGSGAVRIIPSF